jgi:hypothetical protein
MRDKRKPGTVLCSTQGRKGKLVCKQRAYIKTWVEHFTDLLNVQTVFECITENSYTSDYDNAPDKVQVNMLDLEAAMRRMKNSKSPGYEESTIYKLKSAGPIRTQLLFWV